MKNKKHNRYCIGDIHGNYKALMDVLIKSQFDYIDDELICLGDVCDGYPDTYKCVEELLKIKNLILIRGNHDTWLMEHMGVGFVERVWLWQGGQNTVESYKKEEYSFPNFPKTHKEFFDKGLNYYEVDDMLFVHGGFHYPKHPSKNELSVLTWDRTLSYRCMKGLKVEGWKKIFIGHTSIEKEGAKPVIMDNVAKVIKIDCGCGWKGRLCMYNIDTDKYFLSKFSEGHDKY